MKARVTVEVQKSVRIRTMTTFGTMKERVSSTKAYTSPHTAARAYAIASAETWSLRHNIGMVRSALIKNRERKVYNKVRPYFDKLFS